MITEGYQRNMRVEVCYEKKEVIPFLLFFLPSLHTESNKQKKKDQRYRARSAAFLTPLQSFPRDLENGHMNSRNILTFSCLQQPILWIWQIFNFFCPSVTSQAKYIVWPSSPNMFLLQHKCYYTVVVLSYPVFGQYVEPTPTPISRNNLEIVRGYWQLLINFLPVKHHHYPRLLARMCRILSLSFCKMQAKSQWYQSFYYLLLLIHQELWAGKCLLLHDVILSQAITHICTESSHGWMCQQLNQRNSLRLCMLAFTDSNCWFVSGNTGPDPWNELCHRTNNTTCQLY